MDFTDYLPEPEDINPSDIVTVRKRLDTYMAQFWPEVDTRPNSVFGDLHLTPLATLVTAVEYAMAKFKSDLDLSNVSRGIIFDADFVTAYLKTFGLSAKNSVSASGIMKLTFSADQDYSFGLDTPFTFGSSIFKVSRQEDNPVLINSTSNQTGKRVLSKVAEGSYVVLLPIAGPAGSIVNAGDEATSPLSIPELVSVEAVGTFNTGLMPETLPALALKAQRNFASANLTSRSGAISFLFLKFPQILGASATITGDREMIRAGLNPLGILEGAIDVFVKSDKTLVSDLATLPLVYDSDSQAWVGQVNLPVKPAFMDIQAGVFQVGNFLNERGVNTIFSKSSHPYIDNIGISYSRFEVLGIKIIDATPQNFDPSVLSAVSALVSDGTALRINGEYASDVFNAKAERNITMRMDAVTTLNGHPAVRANIRDNLTGEVGVVYFTPNVAVSPTFGVLVRNVGDYKRMLNGFDMQLIPVTGTFSLPTIIGFTYQFSFRGKSANFDFNYFYDPATVLVDGLVQEPNNKPVNVSVLTRSFVVCYISTFIVNYRIPYGATVNQDQVRQAIADYVNGIVFPDAYIESNIGTILSMSGGGTLLSVSKRGTFYPSLATVFVDRNGVEAAIPRLQTTDLTIPVNDFGFGQRNVSYFLDPSTISFNASII